MNIKKTALETEIEISVNEINQLIDLYQSCGYTTLKKIY